jgi:transposase
MAYLSEVSAEQLELVSSALKVLRTVRVKKACTRCDCIVEASAPSRPIDRGIAGPGLLARVLTAKYCEHLPLYRQCEIFARQGVDLSRALLSNWVDACCRLMAPLDEALYRYVMDCRKLHTDDTPVPVLAPGRRRRKPGASGRMCVMTEALDRQTRQRHGSPSPLTDRETSSAASSPLSWRTAGGCLRRVRQVVQRRA